MWAPATREGGGGPSEAVATLLITKPDGGEEGNDSPCGDFGDCEVWEPGPARRLEPPHGGGSIGRQCDLTRASGFSGLRLEGLQLMRIL
jgi:hypothetical protein